MAKEQLFIERYWQEFPEQKKQYDEEQKKKKVTRFSKKYYKFICQCKGGHVFDYRKREKYEDDFHAPCQGKCPICGSTQWSNIIEPIKFNFVG